MKNGEDIRSVVLCCFRQAFLDLAGNHAVFLGLVQGVTEFLPISSSGHLVLLSSFVQELDLLFILVLHLGTLCAVLTYYKKDIALITREFIKNPLKPQGMGKWVYCVAIGTLPSVVGAFFLSPLVQKSLAYPNWTGYGFILTGFCLFLTRKAQAQEKSNIYPKMTTVLIVGVSQVLAFFPGISRSGWTIATALLLGVSRKNATLFSFLLAIPAIIGATSFEILSSADLGSYSLTTLCLAFLSAWGFWAFIFKNFGSFCPEHLVFLVCFLPLAFRFICFIFLPLLMIWSKKGSLFAKPHWFYI